MNALVAWFEGEKGVIVASWALTVTTLGATSAGEAAGLLALDLLDRLAARMLGRPRRRRPAARHRKRRKHE